MKQQTTPQHPSSEQGDYPDLQSANGFCAAVKPLARLLYAVSYAVLQDGGACADAVQNALIKAWNNRRRLRDERKFAPYLLRIVQNESRDLLRRRLRRQESSLDAEIGAELITAEPSQARQETYDTRMDVLAALGTLPEKERMIAMLYYFEQYKTTEISALLKLPEGTVHSRLFRARERLRKELIDYER